MNICKYILYMQRISLYYIKLCYHVTHMFTQNSQYGRSGRYTSVGQSFGPGYRGQPTPSLQSPRGQLSLLPVSSGHRPRSGLREVDTETS